MYSDSDILKLKKCHLTLLPAFAGCPRDLGTESSASSCSACSGNTIVLKFEYNIYCYRSIFIDLMENIFICLFTFY